MHCPTPRCILARLTALCQHHRDKPHIAILTPLVPILHRLCWVEDIIHSGSKPHGHRCDLWASPLWQEVAVDRGQVEAMLDNAWRPAHEQPVFTKEGKTMMQCSVLQSQLKLDVSSLMQLSKLFLLCEHTKDSLSELLTPLTPKAKWTMNFVSNTQSCLCPSFSTSPTQLTEQHPAAPTTLGESVSSREPSLLSSTLTFISVFTSARISVLRKTSPGLKSGAIEGAPNYLGTNGWGSGSFTTAAGFGQCAGRSAKEQRDSSQTYIDPGTGCLSQVYEASPDIKQIFLPKKSR